jgi:signal transduction histidine kinase
MRARLDDRPVNVEVGAEIPRVMMDRELMALAVRQLLDNALKYSRPGAPITLRACAGGQGVQLSVIDSGPGLPRYEQQRIFEKFYRFEGTRNRLPGTGVGLTVVKDIVSAHSGTIGVQSSPNTGTTFTIELPVPRETSA